MGLEAEVTPPPVVREALAGAWGVAGNDDAEGGGGGGGGGGGDGGGVGGGGSDGGNGDYRPFQRGKSRTFLPLVLDEGAVVSVSLPSSAAGGSPTSPAPTLADFVVGFGGGGFPTRPRTVPPTGSGSDADTSTGYGGGGGGGGGRGGGGGDGGSGGGGGNGGGDMREGPLLYAVLSCRRDAESAAAEAIVGADVAVSSPSAAAASAASFDRGGLERGWVGEEGGRGLGAALGGVEEQVSRVHR